jgi:alpha-D-ribose 1-methylphosphonate 5-triphosphate synthase subunit PhnG
VGAALVLAGCSGGGGSASPFGDAPACPILVQLAQIGQTVATSDVSDPAAFDATLKEAVADYVRTAKRLRAAVSSRLRADVDRMITAAQQHRFADAATARAAVDRFARSECRTPK